MLYLNVNGKKQACSFHENTTGTKVMEEVSRRLGTKEFHLMAKVERIRKKPIKTFMRYFPEEN